MSATGVLGMTMTTGLFSEIRRALDDAEKRDGSANPTRTHPSETNSRTDPSQMIERFEPMEHTLARPEAAGTIASPEWEVAWKRERSLRSIEHKARYAEVQLERGNKWPAHRTAAAAVRELQAILPPVSDAMARQERGEALRPEDQLSLSVHQTAHALSLGEPEDLVRGFPGLAEARELWPSPDPETRFGWAQQLAARAEGLSKEGKSYDAVEAAKSSVDELIHLAGTDWDRFEIFEDQAQIESGQFEYWLENDRERNWVIEPETAAGAVARMGEVLELARRSLGMAPDPAPVLKNDARTDPTAIEVRDALFGHLPREDLQQLTLAMRATEERLRSQDPEEAGLYGAVAAVLEGQLVPVEIQDLDNLAGVTREFGRPAQGGAAVAREVAAIAEREADRCPRYEDKDGIWYGAWPGVAAGPSSTSELETNSRTDPSQPIERSEDMKPHQSEQQNYVPGAHASITGELVRRKEFEKMTAVTVKSDLPDGHSRYNQVLLFDEAARRAAAAIEDGAVVWFDARVHENVFEREGQESYRTDVISRRVDRAEPGAAHEAALTVTGELRRGFLTGEKVTMGSLVSETRDGEPRYHSFKAFDDDVRAALQSPQLGDRLTLTGTIGQSSFERDGKKVYTTDLVIDRVAEHTPAPRQAPAPLPTPGNDHRQEHRQTNRPH